MRRSVVALLSVALITSCARTDAPRRGVIESGSPSRLQDALRLHEGYPVVVNYWATWCEPCKEELPRLVAAAKKYAERVRFLGVNVRDDPELAARFAKRYGVPYPSIADPEEAIRRSQRILGLPVTQFYSAGGELAFIHHGDISAEDLEEKIEDVIAVGEPVDEPQTPSGNS